MIEIALKSDTRHILIDDRPQTLRLARIGGKPFIVASGSRGKQYYIPVDNISYVVTHNYEEEAMRRMEG